MQNGWNNTAAVDKNKDKTRKNTEKEKQEHQSI